MTGRSRALLCLGAVTLDVAISTAVWLTAAPRQGDCDGTFFFCSFWDLLPLAATRVAFLCCTVAAVLLATDAFSWPSKPHQHTGTDSSVPLLNGSDHEADEDGETIEALEATRASERFRQACKAVAMVICYTITVLSQVYLALKVGMFKDPTLFERPDAQPASLSFLAHGLGQQVGLLPAWLIPAGLTAAVIAVNLEAMAFSAAIDAVWVARSYTCHALHIHSLTYDPSRVAWSCKSCGTTLGQGFKVAFTCRKCNFSCCLACYRKKRAQERDEDSASPQASSEADISTWKLVAVLLKLVSTEIPLVVMSLLCVMGATVIDNVIPDVQGRIFSDLYVTQDPESQLASFFRHLMSYLYCLLGSMVLGAIKDQTFQVFGLRLINSFQKQLFAQILAQKTEFFDDASVGDLSSRLSREVQQMLNPVSRILPQTISSTGGLIIGVLFCFMYSWKLSLCCFATVPPIIYVSRAYAKWSSQLWMQQYVGWGAANHICNEAFTNIRTVHSFATEAHEESKYNTQMEQMLKYGIRGALGSSGSSLINGVLTVSTSMLVLGYGGYLVLLADFGMDAGRLIAYQLYMNRMQAAFKTLQNQINNLTQATGAAQRVLGLIDSMPEEDRKPEMGPWRNGEVALDNVRCWLALAAPVGYEHWLGQPPGSTCARTWGKGTEAEGREGTGQRRTQPLLM
mmetsp:Transcript_13800/g.39080  ORF Transcript_13800/g.39080 Transcript_13800/m.39080 type:complete len:683 (-) Transcript_13800:1987-4035(-)